MNKGEIIGNIISSITGEVIAYSITRILDVMIKPTIGQIIALSVIIIVFVTIVLLVLEIRPKWLISLIASGILFFIALFIITLVYPPNSPVDSIPTPHPIWRNEQYASIIPRSDKLTLRFSASQGDIVRFIINPCNGLLVNVRPPIPDEETLSHMDIEQTPPPCSFDFYIRYDNYSYYDLIIYNDSNMDVSINVRYDIILEPSCDVFVISSDGLNERNYPSPEGVIIHTYGPNDRVRVRGYVFIDDAIWWATANGWVKGSFTRDPNNCYSATSRMMPFYTRFR